MSQGRLCDLALISKDMEEREKADFDEIMNEFASLKARKSCFVTPIFV